MKVCGSELSKPPVQTKKSVPSWKVSWPTACEASSRFGNSDGVTQPASTKHVCDLGFTCAVCTVPHGTVSADAADGNSKCATASTSRCALERLAMSDPGS